jgi:hypothetical protein
VNIGFEHAANRHAPGDDRRREALVLILRPFGMTGGREVRLPRRHHSTAARDTPAGA